MKKYISIIPAIIAALSIQSFAASITVSQKNDNITVSISEADVNEQITLKVENEMGEIRFLDDNYTDDNGKYTITYKLGDGEDGLFNVTAAVGGVKTDTASFIIRSAEIENTLINTLKEEAAKTSPDAKSLKAVVEKYRLALEINEEIFNSLGNPDEVYEKMVKDGKNADIKDFNDFVNAFYKATLLVKYKELPNKNDICAILTKSPYTEAFGEDGTFFAARMKEIVSDAAPYVTSDMSTDYRSAESFIDDIQFSLLRAAISKSPVWTGVKNVAEKYKTKIGISGSISNDKYKSITGNEYDSYAEVKAALKSSDTLSSGGSSSGGSGSGGNKGGSAMTMPVNPPARPALNEEKQGQSIFVDMNEFKWADEAVTAIYELGIVNGNGNGCFEPSRGVSRAEAAKMLVMLMKQDISNPPYIPFKDVTAESWSYPYIAAAYSKGIVKGKSAEIFDGENGVTRQEMAVMAWNTMKAMGFTDKGRELFEDSDEIADWAKESVEILGNYGIVNGRKEGKGYVFVPNEPINRAEAAMIIYNIAKQLS